MRIEVCLGEGRVLVRACYRPDLAVRRGAVSTAVRAAIRDAAQAAACDAAPDAPLVAARTTVSTGRATPGMLRLRGSYPRSLAVTTASVSDAVQAVLVAAAGGAR